MSSSECTVAVELSVQLLQGKTEQIQLSYAFSEASDKAPADLLDYVAKECCGKYGPLEQIDIMIWDASSGSYVASNNNAALQHMQRYHVTVKAVASSATNGQSEVAVASASDQKVNGRRWSMVRATHHQICV